MRSDDIDSRTQRAATPGDPLAPYLGAGVFIDSDHPEVVDFARRESAGLTDPREIAIRLYDAVRDGFRYDPYRMDLSVDGLKASRCISVGYGFCVPKAALLAAAARVRGVPARVGYADVRNHLTSARLQSMLGTDLFAFHGFTELWLDGRWVKATPAFNLSLCAKAQIHPLDFDGRSDSILQPFDLSGRRHMEYLRDRGSLCRRAARRVARGVARDLSDDGAVAARRRAADFEHEVERRY